MPLTITMQGQKEIAQALMSDQKQKRTMDALAAYARQLAAEVQAEAPVKSGALKKSIVHKRIGAYEYQIIDKVPYSEFVRSDARGGIGGSGKIFPVRKWALYWPGLSHPLPMVGTPVTRDHPGHKANLFHERALQKSDMSLFLQTLSQAFSIQATSI